MSDASRRTGGLRWLAVASIVAAAAAGGACGGSSTSSRAAQQVEPQRGADRGEVLADEQEELDRGLDEVLSRPEVDCAAACDLGDRICELSARICGIARRAPSDAELGGRCEDAAARCESARERVVERCSCEAR